MGNTDFQKINIGNPKVLRCYMNGKNHTLVSEALGDYIGVGKWGLHFLFRLPGYTKDTKQHAIGIAVPRGCEDIERIKEELLAIAPHLFLTEDGFGRIRISHHTRNEYGTYTILYYRKEKKWAIQKHVHYVESKEFMSFDDLVELLRTKHYQFEWDDEEDSEGG